MNRPFFAWAAVAALAGGLAASHAAHANGPSPYFRSAQELYERCTASGEGSAVLRSNCLGYVAGMLDSLRSHDPRQTLSCPPGMPTVQQVAERVVVALRHEAERSTLSAAAIVQRVFLDSSADCAGKG